MVFVMLRFPSHLVASKNSFLKFSSREYSGSDECQKSVFAKIKTAPPIEVFHLTKLYLEDKHEKKVNLGVGAYRTDENKPFVLPIVKKCELEIVKDPDMNHEYLPILGNAEFTKAATELILGKDCKAIEENRIVAAQTVSGTGGIRIAAEFMCQLMKRRTGYMPQPTWGNHFTVFKAAGFKHLQYYPYWNAKKHKIDISKLLAALSEAPEGAVIVFHAAAHNPTGMDPTKKQWKQIAEVIKQRKLFPFFDVAYQGFASGDPDRDAWAVRYFVKEGIETLIAQSFSKNMGLYNERIGNLVAVLNDASHAKAVASQMTTLIRSNYSNPPAFGSRVIAKVLTDVENKCTWLQHLTEMTDRVKTMRRELAEKLTELETPGTWDHIVKQRGMFSMLGLQPEQCDKLIKEKHIYLLRSSRINICGLNTKNIEYVAKSISEVVKEASGGDNDNNNRKSGSTEKDNSKKDVTKDITCSTKTDNKMEAGGSGDKDNKKDKNCNKYAIGSSDNDCNKQVTGSNDKDVTKNSIGSTGGVCAKEAIGLADTKEIIGSTDKDNTQEAIGSSDNDCNKQVTGLTDKDITTESVDSANKDCTKEITGSTNEDNTNEAIGSDDKAWIKEIIGSTEKNYYTKEAIRLADKDCPEQVIGFNDKDFATESTDSANNDCTKEITGSTDKDNTKEAIGSDDKACIKEIIGSTDKDNTKEASGSSDNDCNKQVTGLTDKDITTESIGSAEKDCTIQVFDSTDKDRTNEITGSSDKCCTKEITGSTDKDCSNDMIGSSDKDFTTEVIGSIDKQNKETID